MVSAETNAKGESEDILFRVREEFKLLKKHVPKQLKSSTDNNTKLNVNQILSSECPFLWSPDIYLL